MSYFTEELVTIPLGPSPALCLVHITNCRSGPSPRELGRAVASISGLVRGSCSRRAREMGEPPRGRAAGTEKGECGDRTPPKSCLVRIGEISLTHIVIGGKKEKQINVSSHKTHNVRSQIVKRIFEPREGAETSPPVAAHKQCGSKVEAGQRGLRTS